MTAHQQTTEAATHAEAIRDLTRQAQQDLTGVEDKESPWQTLLRLWAYVAILVGTAWLCWWLGIGPALRYGIQLVLTWMPSLASRETQEAAKLRARIADQMKVEPITPTLRTDLARLIQQENQDPTAEAAMKAESIRIKNQKAGGA